LWSSLLRHPRRRWRPAAAPSRRTHGMRASKLCPAIWWRRWHSQRGQDSVRIAMILRPDADRVFGGDTVVMRKLGATLCDQGIEVVVGRMGEMPPAREFDLLHIFALAPVEHAEAMVAWAQSGGAAIVFSPLYYNDFRDWFERAAVTVPRW